MHGPERMFLGIVPIRVRHGVQAAGGPLGNRARARCERFFVVLFILFAFWVDSNIAVLSGQKS